MLAASHNVNPVINNLERDKIHKKIECLKSKRTSIVVNLCLLQQYKWNTIKIGCRD